MLKHQGSPLLSDTICSPQPSFKIHNHLTLKPKFNYESDDIFQFRIKRVYHRNFRLNGTIYQFYRGIKIKPLKIVKNMKFLRNLTLTDILEMGTRSLLAISNLMQSLKRTSSLQLKFGCIYDWNDPLMNKTLKKILLSNKSHLQSFDLQFCLNDDRHSNGFKLLRLIIKAIQPLHNLKKFNLFLEKQPPVLPFEVLQPMQNYSLTEEKYIRIYQHKFQRLRSLQNLKLKCHVPRFSNFQILSQSLKQFCDLQVLELVLDHIHTTKALLNDLNSLKNLQVLILYYNINPLDLLSISMNSPNIKKLIIREHWIYNPSSFNTLAQIPQTNTTASSLLSLHLDCCLKIVDEDNAIFFSKFLGFFGQICDLKLYLSCEGESYLLNPIAEKINLMKDLKILTLGFGVQTGRQIQRFAECMKDIKSLEKLSFTTKILMGNHEAYRGLHALVQSNPALSEIDLFCKMMDIECMEEFAKIVKSFQNINKLCIFYRTWYETHVKVHEQVLEGIIKALNKAENIKQASIITSCNYLSHTNCETIGDRLKKKIDLKKNIRQFTFSNQWEIQTPFYNDSLSC